MNKCIKMTVVALVAAVGLLLGGCGRESDLEESAVPVVDQILRENVENPAKCVSVSIEKKIADKLYKAKAQLDNGNELVITIEDRGDQIYVQIPPNQ